MIGSKPINQSAHHFLYELSRANDSAQIKQQIILHLDNMARNDQIYNPCCYDFDDLVNYKQKLDIHYVNQKYALINATCREYSVNKKQELTYVFDFTDDEFVEVQDN